MMKKLLFVVACICSLSFMAQAQQLKFGTVEADKIMGQMPELATVQKTLEDDSKQYESELLRMREEFNKKYTEYQALAQSDTVPQAILARRMQEVEDMNSRMNLFLEEIQKKMQEKQAALIAPIRQKVMDAIKAVGTEGNYTYIFDINSGVLYIGTSSVDVTPLVKTKLGLK